VVILDLMLSGMSGLELLRQRRSQADHAAVAILSARGEEEDRLVGLETGADDHVVKPFSLREVVLRVEALLRRRSGSPARSWSAVVSEPGSQTPPATTSTPSMWPPKTWPDAKSSRR
jgi:DNA-binding response OmpR family regulator